MQSRKARTLELTASAADLRALIPFPKTMVDKWVAGHASHAEAAWLLWPVLEREDNVRPGSVSVHASEFH